MPSRSFALALSLATLALVACHDSSSAAKSGVAVQPAVALTPQQSVMSHFAVVSDDQTPLHQTALRDPRGIVWSSAILDEVSQLGRPGCRKIGGVLPTVEQLNQLAIYLGRDNPHLGFHPEYVEFPGGSWRFAGRTLLTSGDALNGPNSLDGDSGELVTTPTYTDGQPTARSALCVIPQKRQGVECAWDAPAKPKVKLSSPFVYSDTSADGVLRVDVSLDDVGSGDSVLASLVFTDIASGQTSLQYAQLVPGVIPGLTIAVNRTGADESKTRYEFSCVLTK